MKKTSLLLAIGALLYGAAGSYALADDVILSPEMTPQEVSAFLDTIVFPEAEQGISEDAPDDPGVSLPAGLDPSQKLPPNVYIAATPSSTPTPLVPGDTSQEVIKPAMCNPNSFPVNGAEMQGILVEVLFADGTTGSDRWKATSTTGGEVGYVLGTGWILAEKGDTWDHQWLLYTTKAIKQIAIKALNVAPPKGRVYAFDVGGKLPRVPAPAVPEHTKGAARGQAFALKYLPAGVSFTATYSDPVYVSGPPGPPFSIHPPVLPKDGNNPAAPGDIPKHDLYGTLVIDFAPSIVGATLIDPIFKFIADTDCLPVTGASVSANLLTLYGEGLVYVSANGSLLSGVPAFEVAEDGVNTFDVSDLITKLHAGACYSLVNEGALGTNIPLEVDGVDMPNGEVCL
ncbi:hypothetical protein THII_1342 [Thioploca ingrica]|uniref:Secreted protein n=1 Tax=Thioploca ingrica TaxID=40754 RepID=A0A090AF40_9GAMM|nr:hypothetical protein THII_1342 [Thioploca ingrica]